MRHKKVGIAASYALDASRALLAAAAALESEHAPEDGAPVGLAVAVVMNELHLMAEQAEEIAADVDGWPRGGPAPPRLTAIRGPRDRRPPPPEAKGPA